MLFRIDVNLGDVIHDETRIYGDGVQLAYSTIRLGRPLIKASNWMTHLEYDLESPIWQHLYRELAQHSDRHYGVAATSARAHIDHARAHDAVVPFEAGLCRSLRQACGHSPGTHCAPALNLQPSTAAACRRQACTPSSAASSSMLQAVARPAWISCSTEPAPLGARIRVARPGAAAWPRR